MFVCFIFFLGRFKCAHVLAVMQANGQLITDGYNLSKISQLTRSKRNGKLDGRKRRGNRRNAKTEVAYNDSDSNNVLSKEHDKSHDNAESGKVDVDTEITPLLQELLQIDFHSIIDQ